MELFDVRLLFSGPLWLAGATCFWLLAMGFLGLCDASRRTVNLPLSFVMLLYPLVLFGLGYVGWAELLIGGTLFFALMMLAWNGLVGLGDALVVPAAVMLFGVLGLVALCIGLFVAVMHSLMDRRESVPTGNTHVDVVSGFEDWRIPMVAYVSLPVCLIGVVAAIMVALD